MSKIKKYKQTIEDVKDFEIVEVSVPEEWIKEIDVEELLQNPDKFQELASNFSTMEETDEDPDAFDNQEEQNLDYNLIEDEEDQTTTHKKNEQVSEIDFPEDEESFEIEEFEEEDFEDYKSNR
ncbi:hypothetical protein [Salegentibacter mishustinae]|uniref:hypothetical protein n=1 Tax=Salegentibacter mishustinae TaxID=270918 RepID=UPI0024934B0F|nr:hypothetical protein [Salegentibacter mishustinae]